MNRAEPGADSAGFDFNGADMGDIFGDIFGDLFGGGRSSRRANNGPMKGANLRASVNITFEEAVFGCEKQLELNLKDECTTCHGSGAKPGTSPETCPKCGGKGQVVYTQQSLFGHGAETSRPVRTATALKGDQGEVPQLPRYRLHLFQEEDRGFDSGGHRRRPEHPHPGKGRAGNQRRPQRAIFWVEVRVARHPIFQRQDMNIFSTAPITFAQAALGGEVRISTVDGDVLYEVKPGTQTDTKVRLKGKGVPSLRNKAVRGDHYVTLVVQVPTKLSEEAKDALREFDAVSGNSLNRQPGKEAEKEKAKEKPKRKGFMDKLKETFED